MSSSSSSRDRNRRVSDSDHDETAMEEEEHTVDSKEEKKNSTKKAPRVKRQFDLEADTPALFALFGQKDVKVQELKPTPLFPPIPENDDEKQRAERLATRKAERDAYKERDPVARAQATLERLKKQKASLEEFVEAAIESDKAGVYIAPPSFHPVPARAPKQFAPIEQFVQHHTPSRAQSGGVKIAVYVGVSKFTGLRQKNFKTLVLLVDSMKYKPADFDLEALQEKKIEKGAIKLANYVQFVWLPFFPTQKDKEMLAVQNAEDDGNRTFPQYTMLRSKALPKQQKAKKGSPTGPKQNKATQLRLRKKNENLREEVEDLRDENADLRKKAAKKKGNPQKKNGQRRRRE